MDKRFLEAIANSPNHRVLGQRLQPFSLWHMVGLHISGSPFAGGSTEFDLLSLSEAVHVCAASFPQLRISSFGYFGNKRFARAFKAALFNRERELEAFKIYQQDYIAQPQYWTTYKGKAVQCPWPLAAWSVLVRYGKFSETEAWNMPIGKALWYKAGLAEANGVELSLVTEAAREALRLAGHKIEGLTT